METEASEKESSSKSKMPRVAVISIAIVAVLSIVTGVVIWMHANKGDVVIPAEETVSVESLLQESRGRGFVPVGNLPKDFDTVSSLEFDAMAGTCFFSMKWTPSDRWSLVKQASSLNQGNDFVLSNPDITTLRRISDFASCFDYESKVDPDIEPPQGP